MDNPVGYKKAKKAIEKKSMRDSVQTKKRTLVKGGKAKKQTDAFHKKGKGEMGY